MRVDFEVNASRERVETYCSGPGLATTPAGIEAFSSQGGCGGGTLEDPDGSGPGAGGVWASVPYFDLGLVLSCNLSTTCVPDVPAGLNDQAGYEALRSIADRLAAELQFIEPVVVSDATTGPDFVRDWAQAGFPSDTAAPEWYCDGYSLRFDGYDYLQMDLQNGPDWTVSDEQVEAKDSVYPQVMLTTGVATTYAVSLVSARCIMDIVIMSG